MSHLQLKKGVRLKSGDLVRLKKHLILRTPDGKVVGYRRVGGVWTFLGVSIRDVEVIWLREPNGDRHTWSFGTFVDWFEKVEREANPAVRRRRIAGGGVHVARPDTTSG